MTTVTPYSPPEFGATIDLDLSKNEGGAPLAVTDAVAEILTSDHINRYPETGALRADLARLNDVEPDRVLVTAGGDDALLRCFLARLGPGKSAVATTPTFEMISRYAAQVGAALIEIPWEAGEYPVDATLKALDEGARVAFVVSPNNPTGAVIDERELRRIAAKASLVVLDGAYTEFADIDLTDVALELGNVVMVRTLSKAWGLAGLRVGYLLGPPDLIEEIGAFGNPYAVTGPSQALARARLTQSDEMTGYVARIRREREEITGTLAPLGIEVTPSQANFVLARFANPQWVTSAAASLGVALRAFPGSERLRESVRITLPGDRTRYERLVRTLLTVMEPQAILFDLDGVLADVEQSQTTTIIETAARLGISVSRAEVVETRAAGGANDDWELTWRMCRDRGCDATLEAVTDLFETIYQGTEGRPGLKMNETALVELDLFRRWAAGRPVGVVTGRPRSDAEEFLDRSGLGESVGALVTRDDAPLKPDPAPVRLAMERLGVERAWMLGDTPDDLVAARQAGAVPIGVLAPGRDRDISRRSLAGAALILEDTKQLEDLLP